MVKRLLALMALALCSHAALAPHPRILLTDSRNGSPLLTLLRAKAAANHPDWTALVSIADTNYKKVTASSTSEQYAFVYALMYQILNGQAASWGAAHKAGDYGAYAKTVMDAAINYWTASDCKNPDLGISNNCWMDLSDPSYWTNESGNLWYTERVYKKGSNNADKGEVALLHAGTANIAKVAKTQLTAQWDWTQQARSGSTPPRVYVYSAGNPAAHGVSVQLAAAWLYSNQLRYRGWTFAAIFDWIADTLTAEQQSAYAALFRVNTAYFLYGSSSGQTRQLMKYPSYSYASNLREGYWLSVLWWGLALQGHGPVDSANSNEEIDGWLAEWNLTPYGIREFLTTGFGAGGVPMEGGDEYGSGQTFTMLLMLLAHQTATGTDLLSQAPNYLANSATALLYATSPAAHPVTGKYFQFTWGEAQKVYFPAVGLREGAVLMSYFLGASDLGKQIRWWSVNRANDYDWTLTGTRVFRMLFTDIPENVTADYRPTLGKGHFAAGTPATWFNSDYTDPNATWGWLLATEMRQEHTRTDMIGGFAVYRGGTPLLEAPQGYHSATSTQGWFSGVEAQPTLGFMRTGVDSFWKGPVQYSDYSANGSLSFASIDRQAVSTDYVYARANTGPGYYLSDPSRDRDLGDFRNVLAATREMVFLPGNLVVFYDRAELAGAARSRLQLPTPANTLNAETDGFTVSSNGNVARVRMVKTPGPVTYAAGEVETLLSPKTHVKFNAYTVPASGTYPWPLTGCCTVVYTPNNIGLATTDDATTSHHWLWTVETGAEGFTPRGVSTLVSDASHDVVKAGNTNPDIVAFSRAGTDTKTATFSASFSGTARVVVAGLQPGSYSVTLDGVKRLTGQMVGADGTLVFPSTAGSLTLNRDGGGPIMIRPPGRLPQARRNSNYNFSFTAENVTGAAVWSVVSGTLPPGMWLSGDGVLSGAPTAAGSSTFTIGVTDDALNSATSTFSLEIAGAPDPLTVDNELATQEAAIGAPFSYTYSAAGGTPPYTFSLSGGCGWLAIGASTGILSGMPPAPGICPVGITVSDSAGQSYEFAAEVYAVAAGGGLQVNALPAATGVLVNYGYRGLPAEQSCTLSLMDARNTVAANLEDDGGPSRRQAFLAGSLAAGALYHVRAVCGVLSERSRPVRGQSFTGPRPLTFRYRPPAWLDASQLDLQFGGTASAGDGEVRTGCATQCRVALAGESRGAVLYRRHVWLGSDGGEKARSSPVPVRVP
jgi:hypothetical protein